jgi:hypothetical protein
LACFSPDSIQICLKQIVIQLEHIIGDAVLVSMPTSICGASIYEHWEGVESFVPAARDGCSRITLEQRSCFEAAANYLQYRVILACGLQQAQSYDKQPPTLNRAARNHPRPLRTQITAEIRRGPILVFDVRIISN